MPNIEPLPARFRGQPFLVSDAAAAGLSRSRLRSSDLAAPFRGVRGDPLALDLVGRCRALQLVAPRAFFSHSTAARLCELPLPLRLGNEALLHISVVEPVRAPSIAGVRSHQLRPTEVVVGEVIAPGTRHGSLRNWTGISISSPALTWCLLAEQVSVPDLVVAADFLVSGTHPLCSITELEAAVAARAGQRHVRALQRAVALVRVGPRSRRESHARLLFGAAGLPEPELNTKIFTEDGRFLAMSDLVWRVFRVAGEYEGEYHQERGQFRKDILRRERVEDNNWRLFRFTGDDLRLRPRETILRVSNRLGLRVSAARMRAALALADEIAL